MVHGTAFGEMTGKFIVGSIDGQGVERALLGKMIGEDPAVSLSQFDIRLPERVSLEVSPMAGFIVGAIVGAIVKSLLK